MHTKLSSRVLEGRCWPTCLCVAVRLDTPACHRPNPVYFTTASAVSLPPHLPGGCGGGAGTIRATQGGHRCSGMNCLGGAKHCYAEVPVCGCGNPRNHCPCCICMCIDDGLASTYAQGCASRVFKSNGDTVNVLVKLFSLPVREHAACKLPLGYHQLFLVTCAYSHTVSVTPMFSSLASSASEGAQHYQSTPPHQRLVRGCN